MVKNLFILLFTFLIFIYIFGSTIFWERFKKIFSSTLFPESLSRIVNEKLLRVLYFSFGLWLLYVFIKAYLIGLLK